MIDWTQMVTAEMKSRASTPNVISDRQFFQVLARRGLISQDEALTAVKTGEPPAVMNGFIASLPPGQQFDARMLIEGATEFRRDHPLVDAFAALVGMKPTDIDALWREASIL